MRSAAVRSSQGQYHGVEGILIEGAEPAVDHAALGIDNHRERQEAAIVAPLLQ